MSVEPLQEIVVKNARTHNLKEVSLRIPHYQLIVITGVSGSGKSSLAFDVIAKEGQRRYFETLPSFTRLYAGKINRPDVDSIEGLSPVITVGQKTTGINSRSTVGTMSDIYDLLRLLYARTGRTKKNIKLSKALFSFNSDIGKCPTCRGIGKEEKIDLNKLIVYPEKTIREGALAPTLPNGYIMYSQVTIDVLNQICEAEQFNVDIPWVNLTEYQQGIVLHGSDKIKVPFGKHSLESRLKWTGIKAKPREEGFYKGMIPIMTDILKRDRNANILKYVHSISCTSCKGERLNQEALNVYVNEKSIACLVNLEFAELIEWGKNENWDRIGTPIVNKIIQRIEMLNNLGLEHLSLNRPASSLTGSEAQRIRIANQLSADLSNVLYIFDEPSIGLCPDENKKMVNYLNELVTRENTVIVVEHDLDIIREADWIIDVGPKAGQDGGELLFNGSLTDFLSSKLKRSPTYRALTEKRITSIKDNHHPEATSLDLIGCSENNLKNINVCFKIGQLNVVSGKSGSGRKSLVKQTLQRVFQPDEIVKVDRVKNIASIDKVISISQAPIGRTPRSNPATYLGISDIIRDLYASLPESKKLKYTKSRFSFNNKGGRCETCQGAGKKQVGMHFLGNVEVICGDCKGLRFNEHTLAVKFNTLSIADIYRLNVDEAVLLFSNNPKILKGLSLMQKIGLGYLTLGQSSTTLSGGEAQRIKIANELQRKDTGNTLYIIDEPSIGLHQYDIQNLLNLFQEIYEKGNTIVCIEQDQLIIENSSWHIELGPKSGQKGGYINHQGPPKEKKKEIKNRNIPLKHDINTSIELKGVTTHQLKNLDATIPKNQLTVVTGISGSGKSSLVYDTLYAEANSRFSESLSTYSRSLLKQNNQAQLMFANGLTPTIGINRKKQINSHRSTIGTLTGLYDYFRLLYSRISQAEGKNHTAQSFSFNHELGACPNCKGLGFQETCNPEILIKNGNLPLLQGPFIINTSLKYYSDPDGQFMATLQEVAHHQDWKISTQWNLLSEKTKHVILYGTGDTEWTANWTFKTKNKSGKQQVTAKWKGICNYIDEEYQSKLHNKNIESLTQLLHNIDCRTCKGSRLKSELLDTKFLGKNIHQMMQLSVDDCLQVLSNPTFLPNTITSKIIDTTIPKVINTLNTIKDLGLSYLNINRTSNTLSGGEYQRICLIGHLSSHLFGVTYVLDEPTIGLDETQINRLIIKLKNLNKKGNTVVVVEHDKKFISEADWVIELGPASGADGGNVIYQGKVELLKEHPEAVTYQLLNQKTELAPKEFKTKSRVFGTIGARKNNLKNVDISFQSNRITAVTGVSGSGKSSLVKEVLYQSYVKNKASNCNSIFGMEQFDNVLLIDQQPICTNALGSTATYTGIIEQLKTLFSKTEYAKSFRLKHADFSYLSKKGKCTSCNGYGHQKTSMDFMSDIWLVCESCDGERYNEQILNCKYQSKSIGEVLRMTIFEASDFFDDAKLNEYLQKLVKIGIGHLQLGQAGSTFSGGEAQRIKLAKQLIENTGDQNLYLFDEPSTGLHYFDILKLIKVFEKLVDNGHTVLFIEHNSTLLSIANEVITLGPGSGENGGELI